MKTHTWNIEKNLQLQEERSISFEEVVFYIQQGNLLEIIEHPNQERYGHQRVYVLEMDEYVYLVPFVESETEVFLKTIIPSRKATKKYLGESP